MRHCGIFNFVCKVHTYVLNILRLLHIMCLFNRLDSTKIIILNHKIQYSYHWRLPKFWSNCWLHTVNRSLGILRLLYCLSMWQVTAMIDNLYDTFRTVICRIPKIRRTEILVYWYIETFRIGKNCWLACYFFMSYSCKIFRM